MRSHVTPSARNEPKDQFSGGNEKISPSRKRNLPPFTAVRAFEAAARHLSFKDAADELCVSPSAISHQIRALEEYLATALFHRDGNRVVLSKTELAYSGRLTDLLDHLAESTATVRSKPSVQLRILCTPGFAARWLVPRLARFDHASTVRLRIATGAPSTNFATNDADVVIQWRDDQPAGVTIWPFLESGRYPVAAPKLLHRENIQHPRDLLRAALLRDETDDMWPTWFSSAGVVGQLENKGPIFPNCEYATTAAESGIGVALGYDAVVRETVAEGRLVRLFGTMTVPFTIYSIACQTSRENETLIHALRDWLLAESKADGTYPDSGTVAIAGF